MNNRITIILIFLAFALMKCGSRKQTDLNKEVTNPQSDFYLPEPNVWKAFGPFGSPLPLAEDNNMTPHGSGRFMCVNVHPKNKEEILIGHATSGLFKSTDGGKTWTQKLPFGFSTGISSILRFRLNSRHLIACSAMDIGNSRQYGYGLFESFDNGETWQRNSLSFDPEEYNLNQCRDIVITDTKKESRLLCITSHDIHQSLNGGLNWEKIFESKYNLKNIYVDPNNENNILVCGNGILTSRDGGKTWTDLSAEISKACGLNYTAYCRQSGGFSLADKGKIYLVNQQEHVFILELKWDVERQYKLLNRNAGRINLARMSFCITPSDNQAKENIWLGTVRLSISSDKGNSFREAGSPVKGSQIHMHDDINMIYTSGNAVYAATDGGVDITEDDGLNWTSLTSSSVNLNTTLMFGFDRSPKDIIVCGTQDNGVMIYRNGQWYCSSMYGDGGRVVSMDDSATFSCGFAQMNFISTDAGKSFQYQHAGNEMTGFDFRLSYIRNSGNFYLANMHLYKKTRGKYFEILSSGLEADRKIKAFHVNPDDENDIWICKDDPSWEGELKNKLLHSTDGGKTWEDMSKSLPILSWRSITDIFIGKNGDIALSLEAFDKNMKGLHKIYISNDGGKSFENISEGLPNLPVNAIIEANGKWICGSNNSVYIYESGKWEILGSGLPATIITELKYFERDSTLWASTFGRGLWVMRLD